MRTVAIIGAGPGGLVSAKYLKERGFEPVVFEQGAVLGGQWNAAASYSGVWPSMRTNTSRVMTCFSDLQHPEGTLVYPTNQEVHQYLYRYAEQAGLLPQLRLSTRVTRVAQTPSDQGWTVEFAGRDGATKSESYGHVVIATGRYHKPMIPVIPGLNTFAGAGGVSHTFEYKLPEQYRGQRVLVAGCSISALEIASDLAMLGAARVVSTNRRQRYVLHKLLAGVPVEHRAFTRFSALALESMPLDVIATNLKEFVTRSSGSPEQFGALKPADNVLEAGITQSQHFLPLVAEGRIVTKPWISSIEGETVTFDDGTREQFDSIIFGTGYDLNLPFLSEELRTKLAVDQSHIELHGFTFHPELPGLAFVGQFELIGPYFPVLELQARWIAYTWSGAIPEPSRQELEAGLAAYQSRRGMPQQYLMHATAVQFARRAGVEPEIQRWPELSRALLFGPLSPASFRLSGTDSLPSAAQRILEDSAAFGAIPTREFTPAEGVQLQALAAARKDATFSQFVGQAS